MIEIVFTPLMTVVQESWPFKNVATHLPAVSICDDDIEICELLGIKYRQVMGKDLNTI